jgi:hypothetical protein
LGDPVTVTAFRLSRTNAIQCHIRRQERERWIGVADLYEESLPEDMAHILDLYRYWSGTWRLAWSRTGFFVRQDIGVAAREAGLESEGFQSLGWKSLG